MELDLGDVTVHYEQHGDGLPALVLHGAGVDHREAEACFEPVFDSHGLKRIYPDLPGMGLTPASYRPPRCCSGTSGTSPLRRHSSTRQPWNASGRTGS